MTVGLCSLPPSTLHYTWRLNLEEHGYGVENKRMEDENWRFDATYILKFSLEEKKAAVVIGERKLAVVERSKMINVFAALAKKLA